MKKGGYQILDLKGVELTTLALIVAGAYAILQNSHRKPILVSGIVIDGEKKNDVFVTPVYDEEDALYSMELYGYKLSIQDDDSVIFESKIIELETPYDVPSANIIEIKDNTLYEIAIDISTLPIDDTKRVKSVFDGAGDIHLKVIAYDGTVLYFLSPYNEAQIVEVELY